VAEASSWQRPTAASCIKVVGAALDLAAGHGLVVDGLEDLLALRVEAVDLLEHREREGVGEAAADGAVLAGGKDGADAAEEVGGHDEEEDGLHGEKRVDDGVGHVLHARYLRRDQVHEGPDRTQKRPHVLEPATDGTHTHTRCQPS
jgi:hypothetical protein